MPSNFPLSKIALALPPRYRVESLTNDFGPFSEVVRELCVGHFYRHKRTKRMPNLNLTGEFYPSFTARTALYSDADKNSIQQTADRLLSVQTRGVGSGCGVRLLYLDYLGFGVWHNTLINLGSVTGVYGFLFVNIFCHSSQSRCHLELSKSTGSPRSTESTAEIETSVNYATSELIMVESDPMAFHPTPTDIRARDHSAFFCK